MVGDGPDPTPSVKERLMEVVRDRYTVEHEIGQGGMATVFVARDERHGRSVAIKVLRPELSAALGEERFHREIEVAATLTHPNILPLYDSGEASGLHYYVMPLVEGESLGDRLRQETHLPLDEAVRIAQQVARALDYAHERGVVHRDIKPDNILLIQGQAVVADFGIARVTGSVESQALTTAGLSVGTPLYMSPEQASAGERLDGRADIYSLGCVLYEMIAGEPPFTGKTMQAVMARHAVDDVPPLRTVRRTVSRGLERIVRKAMAKVPADRYGTAGDLADALEKERVSPGGALSGLEDVAERLGTSVRRSRRSIAAVGAVAVVAVAVALFARPDAGPPGDTLDPELIAVAPFVVTSPGDASLADLEDGIPELMYLRLGAGSGPRTVYPSTASGFWNRVSDGRPLSDSLALAAAREMGAGRLMLGHVLSTSAGLSLAATLLDVAAGTVVARSGDVQGPVDDLLELVDRMTVALLVQVSGETTARLDYFLETDIAAVRAYLTGQAAFHEGRYNDAVAEYVRALDIDSTFAIAGLQLAVANSYDLDINTSIRGLEVAWNQRERLTPRDLVFLRAMRGPGEVVGTSTMRALVEEWQRATELIPDRRTVQFRGADYLFHYGGSVGLAAALPLAEAGFRRTLEIDPNHAPAKAHLFEMAVLRGDTAEALDLGQAYLGDDPGELTPYYRWRLAQLDGPLDADSIATLVDGMDLVSLSRTVWSGQMDGDGLTAAVAAAEEFARRNSDPRDAQMALRIIHMNRGHPSDAFSAVEAVRSVMPFAHDPIREAFDGILWDGDASIAEANAAARSYVDTASVREERPGPFDPLYIDACAVGLWRSSQQEWGSIPRLIQLLDDGAERIFGPLRAVPHLCSAILAAREAVATGRPDADRLLNRLDSIAQEGPASIISEVLVAANLTAAELFEQRGELDRALAALSRRRLSVEEGLIGLSTILREESRIADLAGETDTAIRASRLYLNLRSDPDPRFQDEADIVRGRLSRLLGA